MTNTHNQLRARPWVETWKRRVWTIGPKLDDEHELVLIEHDFVDAQWNVYYNNNGSEVCVPQPSGRQALAFAKETYLKLISPLTHHE